MPFGPGKYDSLCTYVREQAKAKVALVIVLGGEHGQGFSMQVEANSFGVLTDVPRLLRSVADQIESSYHQV